MNFFEETVAMSAPRDADQDGPSRMVSKQWGNTIGMEECRKKHPCVEALRSRYGACGFWAIEDVLDKIKASSRNSAEMSS
ncbi:hypothetical protein RFM68_26170 [Mesorhizobium sp. MSK_1335]|uniref:Uncharacterized protein n=1 Tax=Mesorhizobium montanum TaxID=3072323 RepID=A0ABU4ZRD3_9HYPH|nr:hypothetical protein [Mesorhizobium sp. MSK_1335]MDX8527973.1 hypothetical protein [Mesorhizobium sp. MSK_1335]